MDDYLKERGCTCHEFPPCQFCTDLSEEESDIFWRDGMQALKKYWREQENEG
jgi:hypothetical protein